MKRSSISLVITEMQIKPTKCYQHTAIKWLKKRREVKEGRKERKGKREQGKQVKQRKKGTQKLTRIGVNEAAEQLESIHCLLECKTAQPLWKTVWQLLTELNITYHRTQLSH